MVALHGGFMYGRLPPDVQAAGPTLPDDSMSGRASHVLLQSHVAAERPITNFALIRGGSVHWRTAHVLLQMVRGWERRVAGTTGSVGRAVTAMALEDSYRW